MEVAYADEHAGFAAAVVGGYKLNTIQGTEWQRHQHDSTTGTNNDALSGASSFACTSSAYELSDLVLIIRSNPIKTFSVNVNQLRECLL